MAKPTAQVSVTGLKPVLKALKKLPEKIQRKVIRPAMTKANTPVVKYAKKLVPMGEGLNPDGSTREHLRKTIAKSKVKIYKSGVAVIVMGPKDRAAPHAHLVDEGTKPHDIVLTKPLQLGPTLLPAGFVIHHPGAKPAHFMERAQQATQAQVVAKLEQGLAQGLKKEAAKLAGK